MSSITTADIRAYVSQRQEQGSVAILATGLVLLGTALAACYVPARRASAVGPLVALRQS